MRETIVIQLGNRGANIGSSFWRQISAEHGLENHSFAQKESTNQKPENWASFFHEQNENKIIPRSVIIDVGSTFADTPFLQYPDYNDPEQNHVLLNNRDSDTGKLCDEELSQIESAIRKQIERCDSLAQCIFIRDSTEATSFVIHDIDLANIGLGRKYIHDIVVLADRTSSAEQMINSTLSYDLFAQANPSRIMYQDTAIQRQVHSKNQHSKVDLNRFVAKTLSSFTATDRFNGIGISLSEISHFDPYPGISFTVPSFVTTFDEVSMPCEIDPSTQSLIGNAVQNSSLLCDVDFNAGYYMRIHMFIRGLFRHEVSQSVQQLKETKKIRFVSWCPTGFKVGLDNYNRNSELFKVEERSVCAALHNTSIKSIFQLWHSNIDQLKTQNTLQRLLERINVDDVEFNESFEEINMRILDFTEIEQHELLEDVDN